jgi:hypothetical protein
MWHSSMSHGKSRQLLAVSLQPTIAANQHLIDG